LKQKVTLDAFEGPLDLLLHLIQINEIDITDIPISQITSQYIAYLDSLEVYDLDGASEFIAMAALLLQIKSQELLPKTESPTADEESLRQMLTDKLIAYRQFKYISSFIRGYEAPYGLLVSKDPSMVEVPPAPLESLGIEAGLLEQAFRSAILRSEAATIQNIPKTYALPSVHASVDDKVYELKSILRESPRLGFFEYLQSSNGKDEAIASFLAVLDLYKESYIDLEQALSFGDITITLRVAV